MADAPADARLAARGRRAAAGAGRRGGGAGAARAAGRDRGARRARRRPSTRRAPPRPRPARARLTPAQTPNAGRRLAPQLGPAQARHDDPGVRELGVAAARREAARARQAVPDLALAVRLDRVAQLVHVQHLAPRLVVALDATTVPLEHDKTCHERLTIEVATAESRSRRTCETADTRRTPPRRLRVRRCVRHRRRIVATTAPDLLALAERLDALAAERAAEPIVGDDAARRAARLRDHLAGHVLPRARSLDAPLLVLLIGPTGAGKSSLFNALAGRCASRVRRPAADDPRARRLVRPERPRALHGRRAPLAALAGERLRDRTDADEPRRASCCVDAPDVDSIEHANRELDRPPRRGRRPRDLRDDRDPLRRPRAVGRARRGPATAACRSSSCVNRMPPTRGRPRRRRSTTSTACSRSSASTRAASTPTAGTDAAAELRRRSRRRPRRAANDGLAARRRRAAPRPDRRPRRATATRGARSPRGRSPGSLAGLGAAARARRRRRGARGDRRRRPATDGARRLPSRSSRRSATTSPAGTFLRAEALRQWQAFVGADEVTRLFSQGIGRVRGTLSALIRGTPRAPVAEVREDALDGHRRARPVARRRGGPAHGDRLGRRARDARRGRRRSRSCGRPRPTSTSGSASGWRAGSTSIAEDVRDRGGSGGSPGAPRSGSTRGRRRDARDVRAHRRAHRRRGRASPPATAFLNQKLLEALFGEAALVEMIGGARARLGEALGGDVRRGARRAIERSSRTATGCATSPRGCGRGRGRRGAPAAIPLDARAVSGRRRRRAARAEPARSSRRRAMTDDDDPRRRARRPRRVRAARAAIERCLAALDEAIGAATASGLDVADAEAVAAEARERLGSRRTRTSLALVGGTGVGKSTPAQRARRREVSEAGARRPTTGQPVAWVATTAARASRRSSTGSASASDGSTTTRRSRAS